MKREEAGEVFRLHLEQALELWLAHLEVEELLTPEQKARYEKDIKSIIRLADMQAGGHRAG